MPRFPPIALGVEPLEDRLTPALFGYPWPESTHLTVSFVPDGTLIAPSRVAPDNTVLDGPRSQLFATLDAPATAGWQGEILRALQTWAVQANINVGLVDDDGSPLGTVGALQHDPRFGDIRTINDLVTLSDTELRELKGFGSKALDEVKDKMAELEL